MPKKVIKRSNKRLNRSLRKIIKRSNKKLNRSLRIPNKKLTKKRKKSHPKNTEEYVGKGPPAGADGARIMIGPKRKPLTPSEEEEITPSYEDTGGERELNDFKGYDIIDVQLSDEENKGTLASSGGVIEYHYQNLDNIITYFDRLHKKKQLKSGYPTTKIRSGGVSGSKAIKGNKNMLKDFKDDINFFRPSIDHSLIQVDIPKDTSDPAEKVEGIYTDINKFKENFKKFNVKRFTPITINNLLPLPSGQIENHANMVLIDNTLKQIELFEPHGYKPEKSDSKSSNKAYNDKIKALEAFFKKSDLNNSNHKVSGYKFIASADFVQKEGFQSLFDSNSGYCVTWSALYCHYRILNPDVPVQTLVDYLDESISKTTILRYAKHIEDVLKRKK